jgi:hypothetical protein
MRDFLAIVGALTLINVLGGVIDWIAENWSWWLGPLTLWLVIIGLVIKLVKTTRGEN